MNISYVGDSIIKTPHRKIHLRKFLHVPSASKSLLSVHRIAIDNHVFLEFHPYFFLIKDQATKKVLYRGRCVRGLYPLIPEIRRFNKQVFSATKVSSTRWHGRLGHASFSLVERLLSKINSHMLGIVMLKQFVIRVKGPRATNCLIQFLQVFLPNHCSLSFLMCGVRPLPLLVDILTTSVSLMTIANIHGSIFLRKIRRFPSFSKLPSSS